MATHEVPVNNYSGGTRDDDKETNEELRDVLGGFVLKKASSDATIGEDRASILASIAEENESTKCTEVGQELVSIAEEIDLGYDERFQDLMGRLGTPDLAFNAFQSVAKTLFSWDSAGAQVVRVTWQRIAALFGFCYHLCRQFLLTNHNQRAIQAFFAAIVGFLTRFLLERRLIQWIRSQGGWMSVLHYTSITSFSWTTVAGVGLTVAAGVSFYLYNRYLTS